MAETFESSSEETLCWTHIWFQDGILDIPDGIQMQISRIHDETTELHRDHLRNVLTNYIRSNIHISSWNEILDNFIGNEIFKLLVIAMQESHFSLDTVDIQEWRWEIFRAAIQNFYDNYPEQYQAYYWAWNFEIVFWSENVSLENYLLPIISWENIVAWESEEVQFWTEVENILWVEIHGRKDVNSIGILRTLELKISTSWGDFTHEDAENTLRDAFTLAFEREMSGVMREQTDYMRENYDIWQEAFSQRLTEIENADLQSMLLFLPFVESNLNPRAKSDAGAIGLWQITLATAQRNSGGFNIVEQDLYDPLTSTKLAARYLNQVIENLKSDFWDLDEEQIVIMALREYNGAWSSRLKPEYRIDTFQTVLDIYLLLDLMEAVFEDPKMTESEKYQQMMQYIANIETTYFDGHWLTEFIQESEFDTSEELYEWSQNYMKKIVLQQLMYPYQVMWAYRAYQNIQNTL